jgi:uncharacterized membrane-anchored protein YitT (DUF2179 family)
LSRARPDLHDSARHTAIEDVHALLIGSSFIAVGLTLLKAAGLVTGGVAGVALILSYLGGWPVGVVFFVLNIPFYVLAQRTLGWVFTFKTLATNLLLAGLAWGMPYWLKIGERRSDLRGGVRRHDHRHGHPGPGAAQVQRRRGRGAGALSLRKSAGSAPARCRWLPTAWSWLAAFFTISLRQAAAVLASAVALSVVIIANHKPGRYAGY